MAAPLVPVTLAFMVGMLLGEYVAPHPVGVAAAGLLSAVAALWSRRRAKAKMFAVLLLWLCLGVARVQAWCAHPDARAEAPYRTGTGQAIIPEEPEAVRLHGVVINDPAQPFEPDDSEPSVCVIRLRHAQAPSRTGTGQARQKWQTMSGQVRAVFQSPHALAYGDEILAEGEWSRVPGPTNPGQYDWRASLARQRIHGLLRVKPFHGVVVLRQHQGQAWLAAVFHLRRRWERLIRAHFQDQDAGLLLSLLLGQRVALDERLKDAFVETGTIHLLVISGFNVGLIAWILEMGFRLLGLPWRVRLLGSAICLGGYCVLTGMQPPVVRATLMAWIVLGAMALDRVISWPNTLAAAALAILWLNPTQLFDPGFQLSFGAVLSLMVFTPRWRAWFDRHLGWVRPGWLRRYAAISIAATSAIWLGLSPILAWYFRLVSPVSMLANLLLAPLLSALISFGTSLLMVGSFFEPLVGWGSGAVQWLLHLTIRSVLWCHAIPGGCWFVAQPSPPLIIGYYGLLAMSLLSARIGWSATRALICWLAGLAVWTWSVAALRAIESRWLRVDVLDVGHGDGIVVRLPRGQTWLVDAGSLDAGRFRVMPFLRVLGVTSLDGLVLTHPDADHIGGAIPILQHLRVRRLLTNGAIDDTMSARWVHHLAARQHIPQTALSAGMTWHGDDGTRIEVLHPPPGFVPGAAPASNDNALVLKVAKGSVSVLLTADIEEPGLPWLLREGDALRSTVLKVPHHGSRLGDAGAELFAAVQPKVAILSVGRMHHLPAPDTLQALAKTGAVLYSTRKDGAISLRTDGTRLEVRTFRGRKHMSTRGQMEEITNHQIPISK